MRFHFFAFPQFPVSKGSTKYPFVPLAYNFCTMAMRDGHEVILYAAAGSDAPCTELVQLTTQAELDEFNIEGEEYRAFFEHPLWGRFIERGRQAYATCRNPGDIGIISSGNLHRFVQEAGGLCCEYAVGYGGSFANNQVFASKAWMHHQYGAHGRTCKPGWYDAVIPHYLDKDDWEYQPSGGCYLAFVGRLCAGKGEHFLEDIANVSGVKIVVAGTQPHGHPHWVPPKNPLIEYIGPVNHEQRVKLVGGACGFICPTVYVEPFGMVAIEALACGTPVIATDWGAFTETVNEKVGFRCRTLGEFAAAARWVRVISREDCRKEFLSKYSLEAVWPQYSRYFKRLLTLNDKGWYDTSV